MSDDGGDEYEWDWDDWPDDDEPDSDQPSSCPERGAPALVAVFEDGPSRKPLLAMVDSGLNPGWPTVYEWVAADDSGAACWYLYKHTGNGHYSVALTRRLDA